MKPLTATVVIGALAFAATPALAEMRTLATAGLWSTFGGSTDTQPQVCGITTQGGDGRHITIAQATGETGLMFSLDKPTWSIPEASTLQIAVQFDPLAFVDR